MQLDGMHHITMITGDAQRNVDFYADLLGLRLVKQTVNFDPRRPTTFTSATSGGRPARC
jgi:catechol 2,3-dioxygenase-like lactoylglutathione lyase family enzyme